MKFDVFPNYKIPIDYVYYNELGERCVKHIGWISTPDIQTLKDDHYKNLELIGTGLNYKNYQ